MVRWGSCKKLNAGFTSNSYLSAHTATGPKLMAKAACDDFNKICIDTGRVYQPTFAVYSTLAS
jgi:hypothetical protein